MSIYHYLIALTVMWSSSLCAFSPKHCVPRFGVHQHQKHKHHHNKHQSVSVQPSAESRRTIFYALPIGPESQKISQDIANDPIPLFLDTSHKLAYGITYNEQDGTFVLPEAGVYEFSCTIALQQENAPSITEQPAQCVLVSSNPNQQPIAIPSSVSQLIEHKKDIWIGCSIRYLLPATRITCTNPGETVSLQITADPAEAGVKVSMKDAYSFVFISKIDT